MSKAQKVKLKVLSSILWDGKNAKVGSTITATEKEAQRLVNRGVAEPAKEGKAKKADAKK